MPRLNIVFANAIQPHPFRTRRDNRASRQEKQQQSFRPALAASRSRILALAIIQSFLAPALCLPASGQTQDRIRIEYEPPKTLAHQQLYEELKKARVLELVKEALNSFRLSRPLTLKLTGCEGLSNAWYGGDSITVCYEYTDEIMKNAPDRPLPLGLTRDDVIAGPLVDVFMHEAGHAIFDMFHVPVLGREEDAADQFSAYVMLQFDRERSRRLILGSAYQYTTEMRNPQITLALSKFANEHGIPAQRFYNVLCMAYGADPIFFKDLVEQHYLPEDRAAGCESEYKQVRFAFTKLISPHVQQVQVKRFLRKYQR
jgi:hypothetical protein